MKVQFGIPAQIMGFEEIEVTAFGDVTRPLIRGPRIHHIVLDEQELT